MDGARRWALLEEEWLAKVGISAKKMLRSTGLTGPSGKVFASLVDDELLLKLPAARVDELIDSGLGERFRSGQRVMKEWVSIGAGHEERWPELVREAHDFVERV
jgi:hypothetical protein